MTILDDELVPLALTLITDFGMTVTVEDDKRSYDPTTGKVLPFDNTKHSVKATPPESWVQRYGPSDATQHADTLIWVAASGLPFTPEKDQRVTFDSKDFRVYEVVTVKSGEDVAIYGMRLYSNDADTGTLDVSTA